MGAPGGRGQPGVPGGGGERRHRHPHQQPALQGKGGAPPQRRARSSAGRRLGKPPRDTCWEHMPRSVEPALLQCDVQHRTPHQVHSGLGGAGGPGHVLPPEPHRAGGRTLPGRPGHRRAAAHCPPRVRCALPEGCAAGAASPLPAQYFACRPAAWRAGLPARASLSCPFLLHSRSAWRFDCSMPCKVKCICGACECRPWQAGGHVQRPARREMRQHMGPLSAACTRAGSVHTHALHAILRSQRRARAPAWR